MDAEMLTATQLDALRWLDRFPVHRSGWQCKGKPARAASSTWDAIKLEGPRGSIVIDEPDWKALRDFFEVAPIEAHDRSPWRLTDKGRAALSAPPPHISSETGVCRG